MLPTSKKTATESGSSFPLTRWTLIQRAQRGGEDARGAMEEICRAYWYPIYAYARRSGFTPHDAEDLTQTFFQSVLNYETVQAVRQEKGRMRSFMLALLKRIIANHRRHEMAQKRGGGAASLSFDDLCAEELYAREPADPRNMDDFFDRAWANGVLAAASAKLRADYEKADNLSTYEMLSQFLPLGDNTTPYAQAAAALQMREATLRLQIHRMRKRYKKLIEDEIAQTVSSPEESKAELDHLMTAMGR